MSTPEPSMLAYFHYVWGQSVAYWGNRTLSKMLYRWAVNAFTRAVDRAPGWSPPLLRRAVIRGRELDDYAGAVRDLTTAIAADPQWAEPYLQRGILHSFHALQAAPQAIADFRQFLQHAEPNHSWRPDAERLIERLQGELAERGWDKPMAE
jgi:hypothetical protein